MENKKRYGIKVISEACGIKSHTLRAWEQRYQIFHPERGDNGQRLYGDDDLQKAKLLSKLTMHGHSISSLAVYSVDELQNLESEHDTGSEMVKVRKVDNKNLLSYLKAYNADKIYHELDHLRMTLGVKEFIYNVVLPVVRECGEMVEKGRYTITQEHIITTMIRDQIARINVGTVNYDTGAIFAFATPEGNIHELSIAIADTLARANRVRTRYLGAAHPANCLGEAMDVLKVDYLILGTISSSAWSFQDEMPSYLEILDKNLDRKIHIILGTGGRIKFPKFKNIKSVKVIPSFEEFDKFIQTLDVS